MIYGQSEIESESEIGAESPSESESETAEQFSRYAIGIYGGFHFFYPNDVNDYIESELAGTTATSGFKNMILCFDIGLGFKYMYNENFGIKAGVDGLLGPKIVMNADYSYLLSAVSPGASALAVLPLGDDFSLFAGIGPDFYFSWFKSYFGYGIGGKAELGVQVNREAEVSLVGRYAKIPNRKKINGSKPDFDMEFTGVEIRATYWFNL